MRSCSNGGSLISKQNWDPPVLNHAFIIQKIQNDQPESLLLRLPDATCGYLRPPRTKGNPEVCTFQYTWGYMKLPPASPGKPQVHASLPPWPAWSAGSTPQTRPSRPNGLANPPWRPSHSVRAGLGSPGWAQAGRSGGSSVRQYLMSVPR